MKYQRPYDLIAHFNEDGRLTLRSESSGVGAKVPPFVCAILSFCTTPKSSEQIKKQFGASATGLFEQLVDIGLLCREEESAGQIMQQNFSDINVHRRMLNDQVRLRTYKRAIEKYIKPDSVVIDAGAGTGILSLYAAKAGAARVYAIESNEYALRINQIAEDNDVAHKIKVIQGDFGQVQLPEKADILVTETFGAWALAEGAADDLNRCVERNLKANGKLLPESIDFYIATLGERPAELLQAFYDREDQIDLSHLIPAAKRKSINLVVTEEPLEIHHAGTMSLLQNRLSGQMNLKQNCQALALWFDLNFDDKIILSTGPMAPKTHWKQTVLAATLGAGSHSFSTEPAPADRRACHLQINNEHFHIR